MLDSTGAILSTRLFRVNELIEENETKKCRVVTVHGVPNKTKSIRVKPVYIVGL